MTRQKARLLIFLSIFLTAGFSLSAQGNAPLYSGFPTTSESQAYKQFKTRPVSDYSKVLYLIDRFSDANIEVVYEGHYFTSAFVGRVARWFFARNYRKETPEQWIMKWCNTSVPGGNLIWVKLPSGKFRLSREVLMEELKSLDAVLHTKNPSPVGGLQVDPAAVAQMVDAPVKANPVNAPEQSLRADKTKPSQTLAA